MEDEKIMHRCCFTGHRPEKLHIPEQEAKLRLEMAIRQAIDDGFTTFISGMARGIDMWAAEIVLNERENDDRIKLICAVPFEGFERFWRWHDKNLYKQILEAADHVTYVCDRYSKACFQIRNCYMVDHSKRVIAAFSGEPGGTKNTVMYALAKGIEVVNITNDL